MQLEPPSKRAKFSKSRVATTGKSVAKHSRNINSQSTDVASTSSSSSSSTISSSSSSSGGGGGGGVGSSGIQSKPERGVCGASSDASNSITTTISSDMPQKYKGGVERVIVGRPVYHGELRGAGQYVPEWDPYVMVETVSKVRLFTDNPMLDSGAYTTQPTTSSHSGMNSLKMPNVTSLPVYGSSHISMMENEISQQSVKPRGYSKKGVVSYSHTNKDKGPQKAKTLSNRGRKSNSQKNKGKRLDISSSQPPDGEDASNKQTNPSSKVRVTSHDRGESSRQRLGESSQQHLAHKEWPSLPNLDYSSGKRFEVTFNNETVFIMQYKLLK